MNILIARDEKFTQGKNEYRSINIMAENKEVHVMIVEGSSNYVNIHYRNSVSKAFRGMGKQFDNFHKAKENYKCKYILAAIDAAKNIDTYKSLTVN